MNRHTGASLSSEESIAQSMSDILSTRLGTRVMRREYGSLLPDLVDHPFNDITRLQVYAATVIALMRWEPRISLSRVQFLGTTLQGQASLDIEGSIVDSNQPLSLSVPLHLGGSA
ncbi:MULTISPECIES: GPW/gp25 family protein [Pseudomonas]|uniref:Baseplate assembly protein n=1 Tax=Pseudomonas fluorescens TaxID=294 RepID=A0A0N9XCE9_PSEFL|nr:MULTISPECIES: GPW/gp25 family protein [Pseudomonas]ALI09112.1 baseplate assembly protein [Pseudomonas fluorescens]